MKRMDSSRFFTCLHDSKILRQGASSVAVSSCSASISVPWWRSTAGLAAQLFINRSALCRARCRKRLKGFSCCRSSGRGCSTTKCLPAESPSSHKAPMEATPTSTLPGTGITRVRIKPSAVLRQFVSDTHLRKAVSAGDRRGTC